MTIAESAAIGPLIEDAVSLAKRRLRIPTATYRLQMHAGFTLRDALAIVPYLEQLGISHLYVSSLLTARPGSLHGYDVMNHRQLNPELGTEADLAMLVEALHGRGMGMILDVVPNHMWVGEDNEWWMDVLENGPTSRFAGYFDIAWRNHPRERLRGKVLLPILDEPFGKAIQAGRLRPFFEEGRFGIRVDQTRLPLDPRTYAAFLQPGLDSLKAEAGDEALSVLELQSVLTAVRHLPPRDDPDPNQAAEALAEGIVIKRRLRELVHQHPDVVVHLDHAVEEIGGPKDLSGDFTRLVELLEAQSYRPCFWRVALDEINYRRFFDVNDLAALATERIDVFQAIHVKPFEWLRNGTINGLRIDHIDGLLDPEEYLDRLQRYYLAGCAQELWDADPGKYAGANWSEVEAGVLSALEALPSVSPPLLYVVIEKILGLHESVPALWSCQGTSGYEFLNQVNALFVDPASEKQFTAVYERFTKQTMPFEQIAYEKKLQILRSSLASELHMLAYRLDRLAQMEWWSRDFTLNGLRHALEEMIACFSVYRTYVTDESRPSDQIVILRAARRARKMSPLLGREIFDFICNSLLLREPPTGSVSDEYRREQAQFAGKFQQLTSPVMAKGVEDTTFYNFNRLVSLNEVGGSPEKFGNSPRELHAFFQSRAGTQPHGLSPLSTHDTKRGEDMRARINVLSEFPDEWARRIEYWRRLNQEFKVELDEGVMAPDDNEEYFLYQTLVGVWPEDDGISPIDTGFIVRIQAYMTKALREAKVHSSWIHPESRYDEAVSRFIESILDRNLSPGFVTDLRDFGNQIHPVGRLNSLSQALLRCTAPGVPDIYQGSESWDYSLVDPDNRRPADYSLRKEMRERIEQQGADEPDRGAEFARKELMSDSAKLFVTTKALVLRRQHTELFQNGNYTPLEVEGPDADHVFAFLVSDDTNAVIVAVPFLVGKRFLNREPGSADSLLALVSRLSLPEPWKKQVWINVFTGARLQEDASPPSALTLFSDLPLALLNCSPGL
jgi:(1->4)-alpha-D-glucan 1-alpha-D-glucosylmutase